MPLPLDRVNSWISIFRLRDKVEWDGVERFGQKRKERKKGVETKLGRFSRRNWLINISSMSVGSRHWWCWTSIATTLHPLKIFFFFFSFLLWVCMYIAWIRGAIREQVSERDGEIVRDEEDEKDEAPNGELMEEWEKKIKINKIRRRRKRGRSKKKKGKMSRRSGTIARIRGSSRGFPQRRDARGARSNPTYTKRTTPPSHPWLGDDAL